MSTRRVSNTKWSVNIVLQFTKRFRVAFCENPLLLFQMTALDVLEPFHVCLELQGLAAVGAVKP